MEHENPTSGKRTQCLNSDIISSLPQNIIERILCLTPPRDALRTSILSTKWRYSWRGMPKLTFTNEMVKLPSNSDCTQLKCKLTNAIFHVLLLHNGPEILEFNLSIGELHMESEFVQIFSYLARGNKVKQLSITNDDVSFYKLPISFFSLQGLEHIALQNCTFEPPLTCNIFSRLKSIYFWKVEVSAQMLKRFLSKCPLLEHLYLQHEGSSEVDFTAGGNKFSLVDLLQCVPLIETLLISSYYMKYLSVGGMPHKLPTSFVHLRNLSLMVCLIKQNEISFALCIIKSSPVLERINFWMHGKKELFDQQNSTNFLDPKDCSDLKLDHLETLDIRVLSNLPLAMEFVKLIMAKSPVLKSVRIKLGDNVSMDEEVKMLRDMLLLPFPRASSFAKLMIKRP